MSALHFIHALRALTRELGEKRRKLHRVAFTMCQDRTQADDLVQETLFKALRKFGQLRDVKAMDAWLFQILTNCWRDYLRKQRPTEDLAETGVFDELTTHDDHQQRDIVVKVRCAVAQLPVGQREVLALVDLQGFSYTEVAKLLDIPIGTVTSRICRGRETLRTLLADIAPEPMPQVMYLRRVK